MIPIFAVAGSNPWPQVLDVSQEPAAQHALDRVGARVGLVPPRTSWPLQGAEIRKFLDQAIAISPSALTSADSSDLADLLVGRQELWRGQPGNGGSWFSMEVNARARLSTVDTATPEGPSGDLRRLGQVGGATTGSIGGWFWFHSDAHIFTEWSDNHLFWDRYTTDDGEPSGVPLQDSAQRGRFTKRTGARYVAWVQWANDWMSVKYGRDRVRFGPGVFDGLTTRLESPPYEMLDLRVKPYEWLSIQTTVLEARPHDAIPSTAGKPTFRGDSRKWVHVHRYEVHPVRGLAVAFQNQVVYPDSTGINPTYLLPLVPIFFSQDLAGNRDNAAFQLDAQLRRIPYLDLWGAWMIDDLTGLESAWDAHWTNRWGVLGGFRAISPWKGWDADLVVEATAVRPWTYTGGREAAYSFAHYGLPMGSSLGPDSRTLRTRLSWRASPKWNLALEGRSERKGVGAPATLGVVWNTRQGGQTSEFFEQGSGDHLSLTPSMGWEPWRDAHVDIAWTVGRTRQSGRSPQVWNSPSLDLQVDL